MEQKIYINLDDSGKLTRKEKICVYGGIVFISKNERDKYINTYKKIKEIIKDLINKGIIKPNKDLKIIIDIDEQTTKTNGYYSLKDSIYEELKYGISNFDYGMQIKPIIHAKLSIILTYRVSSTSYIIQAADLIAGTIRKTILSSKDSDIISSLDFITYKTIFPRKKTT